MKRTISVLITIMLIATAMPAQAAGTFVETNREWRATLFLANQIHGIGLVDSYQEDYNDRSYVYDNALAAMAFMATGNFGFAKEILDTLTSEVSVTINKVPYESYLYYDANANGYGLAYSGNCAWLLQALNMYQKLRSSKIYVTQQKALADFLLSLQDSDGGIKGSIYDSWKSTEHNMIAYAAIRNFGRLNAQTTYVTLAAKIKTFLTSTAVWNGSFFNRGPNDGTRVIDVQAFGAMLFGGKYVQALAWAETTLKTVKEFNGNIVTGFDFNDDLDTVWIEGTLQVALAYRKALNTTKADEYLAEALKTEMADGSLVLATNRGTATDSWMLEVWRAVAPTSWLILNSRQFYPLTLY